MKYLSTCFTFFRKKKRYFVVINAISKMFLTLSLLKVLIHMQKLTLLRYDNGKLQHFRFFVFF